MLTVGIFVFDEVEVLDFAGPFEVFSTASRVSAKGGAVPFRTVTIAKSCAFPGWAPDPTSPLVR
ncbi:MAG: hypothetical protein KA712_14260 [Myxococcales bacterium]|nr:hypothetical protein [Myxococcales bacterium]